jgi:hypothetical protein
MKWRKQKIQLEEPWIGLEIGNRDLREAKVTMVLTIMAMEDNITELEHIRDHCIELINECGGRV